MYINMTKGSTWDEFRDIDLTYSYRRQHKRSLEEIDTLIERQQSLKHFIGPERSAEIERDPDLFYNHEKFRIWQAKARFRAFITTLVAVPAVFTVANGGRNGSGLMRRNPTISLAAIVGTYVTTFYLWHRIVGYNKQAQNEQLYAKNVKMLRNLLIKQ